MTTLSNAETALLGLLAEGPRHPYQIEKEVEFRDMRSWTDLSMSAIYKLLAGLEKKGLVRGHAELAARNRTRKVYRLAPAGRRALRASVLALLRTAKVARDPFHVAIYNAGVLGHLTVCRALRAYRRSLESLVDCYGNLEQYMVGQNCSRYHLAVASRPRHLMAADIAWVDGVLKAWNRPPSRTRRAAAR
jgi:DNA-binding PadR family transcriptional regulator